LEEVLEACLVSHVFEEEGKVAILGVILVLIVSFLHGLEEDGRKEFLDFVLIDECGHEV
jgi:hypothetical protein